MEQDLKNKIENILAGIRPSLGGADIRLKDFSQGTVILEYRKALSNPSACHVDRTKATREIVIETLEDDLKKALPGFKKVVVLGED